VDIPAFLILTKENRKGLRHVHESIVSRVWNSWVSACSYGIRGWKGGLQIEPGPGQYDVPMLQLLSSNDERVSSPELPMCAYRAEACRD
jgi:hypothetical protein